MLLAGAGDVTVSAVALDRAAVEIAGAGLVAAKADCPDTVRPALELADAGEVTARVATPTDVTEKTAVDTAGAGDDAASTVAAGGATMVGDATDAAGPGLFVEKAKGWIVGLAAR